MLDNRKIKEFETLLKKIVGGTAFKKMLKEIVLEVNDIVRRDTKQKKKDTELLSEIKLLNTNIEKLISVISQKGIGVNEDKKEESSE